MQTCRADLRRLHVVVDARLPWAWWSSSVAASSPTGASCPVDDASLSTLPMWVSTVLGVSVTGRANADGRRPSRVRHRRCIGVPVFFGMLSRVRGSAALFLLVERFTAADGISHDEDVLRAPVRVPGAGTDARDVRLPGSGRATGSVAVVGGESDGCGVVQLPDHPPTLNSTAAAVLVRMIRRARDEARQDGGETGRTS